MSKAYVVKKGDTLSGISVKYLGSSGKWTRIANTNPQLAERKRIYDGSPVIFPGDTLIIPENETQKPASAKTKKGVRVKQVPQKGKILPANSKRVIKGLQHFELRAYPETIEKRENGIKIATEVTYETEKIMGNNRRVLGKSEGFTGCA
jgi:LysM repeat protein